MFFLGLFNKLLKYCSNLTYNIFADTRFMSDSINVNIIGYAKKK